MWEGIFNVGQGADQEGSVLWGQSLLESLNECGDFSLDGEDSFLCINWGYFSISCAIIKMVFQCGFDVVATFSDCRAQVLIGTGYKCVG